jgi:stage IV sporulation protein FB
MITAFETLDLRQTIGEGRGAPVADHQHEFPVVDVAGRLRGVLTRNAMIQALSQIRPGLPRAGGHDRDIPTVSNLSRLESALQLLQGRNAPAVGVVDWEGRLIGYITSENIGELMMVESAGLGLRPRRLPAPCCRNNGRWPCPSEPLAF